MKTFVLNRSIKPNRNNVLRCSNKYHVRFLTIFCIICLIFCQTYGISKASSFSDSSELKFSAYNDNWLVTKYDSTKLRKDRMLIVADKYTEGKVLGIANEVFANQTFSMISIKTNENYLMGKKCFENVVVDSKTDDKGFSVYIGDNTIANIPISCFENATIKGTLIIYAMNGIIREGAFRNATIGNRLVISTGTVKEIETRAFSGTNAKELILPECIQAIDDFAFEKSNIDHFSLSKELNYIGSKIFDQCENIRTITMPETNLENNSELYVAEDAFPNQSDITFIIPANFTDVDAYHLENYSQAHFQLDKDIKDDSEVVEFMKAHKLNYQKGTTEDAISATPSAEPTAAPTPSTEPTAAPTPSAEPTAAPTPSIEPTAAPTPSAEPTVAPTPSAEPTAAPTPSAEPTAAPTPSIEPTAAPTPSIEPTAAPTPSIEPTTAPTPSTEPTVAPTPNPSPKVDIPQNNSEASMKDYFVINQLKYKILSNKTVMLTKVLNKNKKSLKIPDTVGYHGRLYRVEELDDSLCKSMTKLKTVTVGNYVKTVGDSCFADCKKLKKITFGKRIVTIKNKVLYHDKRLKTIVFNSYRIRKIGKKTFFGVPKKVDISVPKNKVKQYRKLIRQSK